MHMCDKDLDDPYDDSDVILQIKMLSCLTAAITFL